MANPRARPLSSRRYDFHEREDTALRDLVARARANGGTRNDFKCRRKEEAGAEAGLDMKSSGMLNKIASATIRECLPKGQARAAPPGPACPTAAADDPSYNN